MIIRRVVFWPLLGAITAIILVICTAGSSLAEALVVVRTEAPATPSTGVGIRLLDIPTETRDDPRAQSYIVDHVQPGTTIERRIEVSNHSSSEQSLRIYGAAAKIVEGSFQPDDESPNELSTWIESDPEQVDLAPNDRADALITIRVPMEAPEGEQYAAVWAEVRDEGGEGQVALAHRVGIRIYLSVGPGNGPPADFSIETITAERDENGSPVVTAQVTNTGGRAVDLTGEISLAEGPGGVSAGPFTADSGSTIEPNGTGQVRIVMDPQLPDGPWQANLKLTSGLLTRDATAEVSFSADSEPVQAQTEAEVFPWWWLVVAAVLTLAVLAAVLWRRRERALTNRSGRRRRAA